ncbi:MAG: hypothetical protein AB7N76_01710 [Planctomycetota bacterium]
MPSPEVPTDERFHVDDGALQRLLSLGPGADLSGLAPEETARLLGVALDELRRNQDEATLLRRSLELERLVTDLWAREFDARFYAGSP